VRLGIAILERRGAVLAERRSRGVRIATHRKGGGPPKSGHPAPLPIFREVIVRNRRKTDNGGKTEKQRDAHTKRSK
jgi:hypothetical protein